MEYSIMNIIFIMRQRVNSELFQPCMDNFLFDAYSRMSDTETFYELVGIRKVRF